LDQQKAALDRLVQSRRRTAPPVQVVAETEPEAPAEPAPEAPPEAPAEG
jgi:hypothetical protein